MNPVQSARITRSFTQKIDAPPARVFPLLCPVREMEWLDGWKDQVEIIHSDSGVAEAGCVFRTSTAGQPETVWVVTRHDPAERVVEFARVTTGLVATTLRITVDPAVDGSSRVHIAYTLTPLGESATGFLAERWSEAAFRKAMVFWEDSMNHWLQTGALLPARAV